MTEKPKPKLDALFQQQCVFHNRSETGLLGDAIAQYCENTGQEQPDKPSPEFIRQAKRHYLSNQEVFLMNLTQPCQPVGEAQWIVAE